MTDRCRVCFETTTTGCWHADSGGDVCIWCWGTFSHYLLHQRTRGDEIGRLARDAEENPEWPGRFFYALADFLPHVEGRGDAGIVALARAWAEWECRETEGPSSPPKTTRIFPPPETPEP